MSTTDAVTARDFAHSTPRRARHTRRYAHNKAPPAKLKMDNLLKKLNLVLAILGTLAPLGYFIGINFNQGKLHAYGISSNAFPLSTQEVYIMAYYAIFYILLSIANLVADLFKIITTISGFLTTITILLTFVSIIYLIIKNIGDNDSKTTNKWIIKVKDFLIKLHWDNNNFTKAVGITGILSYLTFSALYLLMLTPIVYIAMPYIAFAQGEKTEQEKRDNYITNGCTQEKKQIFNTCHTLKSKDGDTIIEGLLITESEKMIAFLTKDGSYVLERPKDAILIKTVYK